MSRSLNKTLFSKVKRVFKPTIPHMLAMLLIFLIPGFGEAQETRPALLTFSLIEQHGFVETIYLYNPDSRELETMGIGDSVRWSPSGRYLAMADTVSAVSTPGKNLGKIIKFGVYDFENGVSYAWEYPYGDSLVWSPDETYLIAAGSTYSSSGSNAWVDFFNPDGSGEEPEIHLGFVDGIMGSRGGTFTVGWVGSGESGQLLVRDVGIRRDDYVLIDPAS